jgi:hypothetical protein
MTPAPRWLDRAALATHLSVAVEDLPGLQRAGKIPPPSLTLGARRPRWDREAVDRRLAGDATSSNARSAISEAAQAIAQGR